MVYFLKRQGRRFVIVERAVELAAALGRSSEKV
jgi:hypothetical protein